MTSGVDPAVEAVIARVKAVYGRWRRDTPVARMRADWDALFGAAVDATVVEIDAGGVRCQWIVAPGARADRIVLYFHGGGFQVGSLRSHLDLMARISAAAQARVLGVDYRLAPEHRYPAAHEDARTVYQWLLGQGVPAGRIAVAGDSAGGGLALSLPLWLQQRDIAQPCGAWTMSAWTDLTASGTAYQSRAGLDPIHQRGMILAMAGNFLGAGADAADPLASPLFAAPHQLAALPPVLLQVGARETVVSDSEDFAARVAAAGGTAELQVWPGMIHVFQQFAADLPQARAAIARGGQFLADQFDAARNKESTT
ncbi:MAG: alpha/beta hydrolase [Ferrovibrionaceae bacterium]